MPDDVAQAIFEAVEDRMIEKMRWKIRPWELDRFLGPLEGLALLEIELDADDSPIPGSSQGVQVLREVTNVNTLLVTTSRI